MTDLSSLIDRLEKATGPSRDLDVEIINALDPRSSDEKRLFAGKLYQASWGAVGQLCDHIRYFVEAPFPTSSIDAAVALAERVLPGWCFDEIGQDWEGSPAGVTGFGWTVEMVNGLTRVQGQSETFPIAILLATLRALQSKGPEA